MRLRVDQQKCEGHNRCYNAFPELFDVDDEGKSLSADGSGASRVGGTGGTGGGQLSGACHLSGAVTALPGRWQVSVGVIEDQAAEGVNPAIPKNVKPW